MKKVTYTCNLCMEEKTKSDLKAFYFKCDILPQQYVLVESLNSCDKHICQDCIKVIKNA